MAKEKFDKSLADFNYNTKAFEKYKAAIRRQRSTQRLGDRFVQGFDLLKRAGLAIKDTAFPDPAKAKYRLQMNPEGLGTKLVEKQRPNYNPSDYGLRRTKAGEQTWQNNMFGGNKSQLKLTESEATQQPEAPVAPPQGANTAQAAVTTPTRDAVVAPKRGSKQDLNQTYMDARAKALKIKDPKERAIALEGVTQMGREFHSQYFGKK